LLALRLLAGGYDSRLRLAGADVERRSVRDENLLRVYGRARDNESYDKKTKVLDHVRSFFLVAS
jgi:hypothetical protein